jgi:hypothetical protein
MVSNTQLKLMDNLFKKSSPDWESCFEAAMDASRVGWVLVVFNASGKPASNRSIFYPSIMKASKKSGLPLLLG